jgi:hypothetical protein
MTADDFRPLTSPLKICSALLLAYAALRFAGAIFSAHSAAEIVAKATTGRPLASLVAGAHFLGEHPMVSISALTLCVAAFLYATARDSTFSFLTRNACLAFLLLSAAAVLDPLARQAVEELLPYYGTIGFR